MIKVNDILITEEDIAQEAQYHPAKTKSEALSLAANALIIEHLIKQRAEQLGIETEHALKEDYIDLVIEADVNYPVAAEEELLRYFEENKEKFTSTPYVEASHLLLTAAPEDLNTRAQHIKKAQQWIDELNQGVADFAQLARKHSDCPSKESDGFLGVLERGSTVPEFEKKVFPAAVGYMPYPIETRYGVHVIWIHKKTPGKPLAFSAVKTKIEAFLNNAVQRQAIAQYLEKLTREANIEGLEHVTEKQPI